MTKKLLTVMLSIIVILSILVPVALADVNAPGNSGAAIERAKDKDEKQEKDKEAEKEQRKEDKDQRTQERDAQKQAREEEHEQKKVEIEQRKLVRNEIKTASKEALREQQQLMRQYKEEIKAMVMLYAGMSEEEKALYLPEIQALRSEMHEAHAYTMQVRAAIKGHVTNIFDDVQTGETPNVQDLLELLEEMTAQLPIVPSTPEPSVSPDVTLEPTPEAPTPEPSATPAPTMIPEA